MNIGFNPYFDDVLRAHLMRAAQSRGVSLPDLEDLLACEADAIEYLKECGVETYLAYLEEASEVVDHVGWVLTPKASRGRAIRS